MLGQGGAQRRAVAAIIEPSAHPEGGAEQRRRVPIRRQCHAGMLDRLRLGRVGLDEPAPQSVGMTRRLEDGAAIDDRGGPVHPEADPFDHRGEMPGVDHQPVACGVPADRVEPDPPQPGGGERMPGQERVEAGDRRHGLFEGAGKCRELVEHPGCGAHRFAARGGADG